MTKRIVFLSVLIMFLQFLLMMCLSPYVDQKTFVLLLPRFLLLVMKILSSYKSDEFYFNICNYLDNPKHPIPHPQIDKFISSNSFLLFNNKIYIPLNCCSFILKICHGSQAARHFGIKKTSSLISRDFWWPSLSYDVADYIHSCETCSRSKPSRHKPYGFHKPLAIADRP